MNIQEYTIKTIDKFYNYMFKRNVVLVLCLLLLILNVVGVINNKISGQSYFSEIVDDVSNDISLTSDFSRMNRIYRIVTDRYPWPSNKKDIPRYSIDSNWVLFFLGFVSERFNQIRLPDYLLLQDGMPACSELSYLMISLAEATGIKSRHVGLNGHVVMEAFFDNEWHLYDPLYRVSPLDTSGSDLSVSKLENDPEFAMRIYAEKIHDKKLVQDTVSFYVTKFDNNFVSFPRLAQFHYKATLLLRFEELTHFLKWALPFLFVCWFLVIRKALLWLTRFN